METTLTKRTLSGAIVKASSQTQNKTNQYLLTIKIEKTGHDLLIGGTVNVKTSGLNQFAFDVITNGVSQAVSDFFNKERIFTVIDANTLICNVDINSSFGNEVVIGGTPLVQVNNDKITLPKGLYNFELINDTDFSNLRVWQDGYRFAFKEIAIGSKGIYTSLVDTYGDGELEELTNINEQNLTFANNEVELYLVDATNIPIPVNIYTNITNIGIIINKI